MDELGIFSTALELETPAERQRFLAEACRDDTALRVKIDALLQSSRHADGFLESPPVANFGAATPDRPITEGSGTRVGPYKLLQQIGEGGFGVVYMAEQQQPFRRKVALKIIKPGMDTNEVIARFESERQALALMDHANIAKVLDAGATESGRLYFVMELVKGIPITKFCDDNHLPPEERLTLFIQVCNALQHAHQKGIIHRDLKPSNVMVTMRDGCPVPKVIDFGVAKATSQTLTERTLFTAYGQMIGTPAYMSPEQAEMSCLDIDTRSDIYSLGVLLYELLTGTTPFEAKRLREAGFAEMQRIIRDEEPQKPSTRVSTLQGPALTSLSQQHGIDERRLRQHLHGELDWIVMKSLDKDREQRYESAVSLARDIRRYLSDEPVQACPPTVLYRFQKYGRKHRAALTTAVLLAASVLVGAAVSAWQAVRATQAEAQANANEQKAVTNEQRAVANAAAAEQKEQEAIKQRDEVKALNDRLAAKEQQLQRTLYAAHMNLAKNAWDVGGSQRVLDLLNQYRPKPGEPDLRGFEWHYLNRLCHQELLTLKGHTTKVGGVAISPDGKLLASISYDQTIRIWDAETGREIRSLKGGHDSVVFSPDGKRLAGALWDETAGEFLIKVWKVETGEELLTIKGAGPHVVFSPDGKRLACGSGFHDEYKRKFLDGNSKVWDAETGQELLTLKGPDSRIGVVAYSPDGLRLACAASDGTINVLDTQTGEDVLSVEHRGSGWVLSMAFSPDGKRLASADSSKFKVWDAQTGRLQLSINADSRAMVFSPDGNRLATAVKGNAVKMWDSQSGRLLFTLLGHNGQVSGLAYSADGKRLVSSSADQTVKVWDVQAPRNPEVVKVENPIWHVAFTADGKRLVAATTRWSNDLRWHTDKLKVWDALTLREILTFNKHADAYANESFTRDGNRLASVVDQKLVKVWDVPSGQELFVGQGHIGKVVRVAFSPDGKYLASSAWDGTGKQGEVKLWNAQTGEEQLSPKGQASLIQTAYGPIVQMAFSPDSKSLACTGIDQISVRDVQSGEEILSIQGTTQFAAFSPDGKRLVTGKKTPNLDGTFGMGSVFRVLDAQTGKELLSCQGHTAGVGGAIFSPDGKRLASSSQDTIVKLWDAQTGEELLSLAQDTFGSLAFSPDGYRLASGSQDRTLTIYDGTPLPEKP